LKQKIEEKERKREKERNVVFEFYLVLVLLLDLLFFKIGGTTAIPGTVGIIGSGEKTCAL
jgi:hypothetical protein